MTATKTIGDPNAPLWGYSYSTKPSGDGAYGMTRPSPASGYTLAAALRSYDEEPVIRNRGGASVRVAWWHNSHRILEIDGLDVDLVGLRGMAEDGVTLEIVTAVDAD